MSEQHRFPRPFLLRSLLLAVVLPGAVLTGTLPAWSADQLERVVIVFKTHFDIGYTDLASNVLQRYRTSMIDEALEVCDRSRDLPPQQRFVWTLPGWPMAQITAPWPGQTEERQQRISAALQEGRFVVHGLPFTTHTELLEPEDLVRGLGFASRVSRVANLALPRDAKMTDVPCHSWILPTLLRHAGIEFLHLGCNAGSQSPEVPLLFWWEGPDGSRLLTMYVAEGYGTGLLPPADWPHRTWLALIHTGDNHGPPRPDEVTQLLQQLREKHPNVQIQIGRLADFADTLLAEAPQLPVVRGDMPDTWIHGPMCDPQGASLARTIRPAIASSESLNTLLRLWGGAVENIAPTVAAAYEQSLLYGEHTWGGALYWVTRYDQGEAMSYGQSWRKLRDEGKFDKLEASWAEHTAYIERARDLIQPALDKQLNTLSQSVNQQGTRLVVYNPLPWRRSGLVTITREKGAEPAASWLQAADDNACTTPVHRQDNCLQFVAHDVPAMGYRTFLPMDGQEHEQTIHCDPEAHTISSPHFRVQIDPRRGTVRSLVDTRSGREWVDQEATHKFGQYLYERFDHDQAAAFVKAYVKIDAAWAVTELGKPNLPPSEEVPYRAVVPGEFQVRYESTPVGVSAILKSSTDEQLTHRVTTRITAYDALPCVDIEMTLHDKPADPWPEAGWLCLPIQSTAGRVQLGRLGSIVDPTYDLVPGSNHHLFALHTGLSVTDSDGSALAICALDSPLVSLDEPGCWKYSKRNIPRTSHVYVNLFNNQWTTNFRLWNEGTWTSRVRIWSIDPNEIAAGRVAQAMTVSALEARYPLLSQVATGPAGPLPLVNSGPSLPANGILVTALGPNPDGSGTLLRLWDLAGNSGTCPLRLPASLQTPTIQQIDLRGNAADTALHPTGTELLINLQPFAPHSLLFEP